MAEFNNMMFDKITYANIGRISEYSNIPTFKYSKGLSKNAFHWCM